MPDIADATDTVVIETRQNEHAMFKFGETLRRMARLFLTGALCRPDVLTGVGRSSMETPMNWDQIAGSWKQFVGQAKEQWGKLTDDDWNIIAGKRDQLIGKIQERYGKTREEAEREVAEYERTYSAPVGGP